MGVSLVQLDKEIEEDEQEQQALNDMEGVHEQGMAHSTMEDDDDNHDEDEAALAAALAAARAVAAAATAEADLVHTESAAASTTPASAAVDRNTSSLNGSGSSGGPGGVIGGDTPKDNRDEADGGDHNPMDVTDNRDNSNSNSENQVSDGNILDREKTGADADNRGNMGAGSAVPATTAPAKGDRPRGEGGVSEEGGHRSPVPASRSAGADLEGNGGRPSRRRRRRSSIEARAPPRHAGKQAEVKCWTGCFALNADVKYCRCQVFRADSRDTSSLRTS